MNPAAPEGESRSATASVPQHIVLMGVAGSGKTTIAALLSERLGWLSAEADAFHPAANIAKMASGIPLEDADRWPWLEDIRAWMSSQARDGKSTIVTCSALKRTYREALSTAQGNVVFIHLAGSPAVLRQRMEARSGHFMPESLLPSQLATLEPLAPEERGITVNIVSPPASIVEHILRQLRFPACQEN